MTDQMVDILGALTGAAIKVVLLTRVLLFILNKFRVPNPARIWISYSLFIFIDVILILLINNTEAIRLITLDIPGIVGWLIYDFVSDKRLLAKINKTS